MRKRQQQWDARLEKYPGAPVSNVDEGDEAAPRKGARRRSAAG
jgi:hypothetical protein